MKSPPQTPNLSSPDEICTGFEKVLARRVSDPLDREHLRLFAHDLLRARLEDTRAVRHPVCRGDRVRREVGRRLVGMVNGMARLVDKTGLGYRALLPRAATVAQLRTIAEHSAHTREGFLEWIHFFQGAVDRGLFAPGLPAGTRIPRGRCALRARQRRDERRPIRSEDVVRLESAVRTTREGALLALLRHTGLRREAVASLRVQDVWDGERGCVRREGFHATEKYGESRWVGAVPEALHAALDVYLRSLESPLLAGEGGWLFPAGRSGATRACPSLVTSTLQRLCRRANIRPPFRPHQFRTYVVDEIVARGGSLRDAARFLGHRSVVVTYQYYFSGGLDRGRIPTIAERSPEEKEKWALLLRLRAMRHRLEGR